MYESLKRSIQMKIDEIVENFLKYLKDIKSQDEFEGRFEEYVLYHLDINVLLSLKLSINTQFIEIAKFNYFYKVLLFFKINILFLK